MRRICGCSRRGRGWAGQGVRLARRRPAGALGARLAEEATKAVRRLAAAAE